MPQIIQKIRVLRELEKSNRDAPVFSINEFFSQNPYAGEDEILIFMNRLRGSKEFEKKGDVVDDVEADLVQEARKESAAVEQIAEENEIISSRPIQPTTEKDLLEKPPVKSSSPSDQEF